MRSERGQTTIEMIVVIGLILIVFTVVVLFAHRKNLESNDFKMMLDAKRVGQSIADNINTIAEQGSGYYTYFTLPPRIFGEREYNISVYGNFVEIDWESRSGEQRWSTQLVTANVSRYCLDKGGTARNKIFNFNERILITCNRADLMPIEGSFKPAKAVNGTDITFTVDVFNYGVLDSGKFNVTFAFRNMSWWNYSREIADLGADEMVTVNATIPSSNTTVPSGVYPMEIYVDPEGLINESYKGDNWCNTSSSVCNISLTLTT
jgi:hypothetical protein